VLKVDVNQLKEDVAQLKREVAELNVTVAAMNARMDQFATKAALLELEVRMKNWMVRFGISLIIVSTTIQLALFQAFR
jgi:cell division protein FtsB